jgi:putative transposase
MARRRYPTDLTDAEWSILEPLIPPAKPGGRPRSIDMREVVNAICYVLRGGIPWRMLPPDLPPWKTVYHYFRLWRIDGRWEELNGILCQRLRVRMGREATPSGGIIDSQSAKTTEKGALEAMTAARK